MERFNKSNVSDKILKEIERLKDKYNFNPNKGFIQVINTNIETIMAYGQYTALISLHEELFENDKNYYSL